MITIGVPYIMKVQTGSRLCSDICCPKMEKTFYFEVPEEYEKYLCKEVADAFLVGILNYAFKMGENIKVEAPVSERLLYQLQTYFLPTLPVVREKTYKPISIEAEPYTGTIESESAVGTSASGGVDSYYSIKRHMNDVPSRYHLTHLLIANQFNYYVSEEKTREQFRELVDASKKIVDNYELKLVPLYTNHHEFLFDGFVQEYTLRMCSYAFALQKLFSVYYISSGVPFKEFSFANHDSDGFDIFNLALMSTDNLSFYSSGGEITRTQKIEYFSDDPYIQKNLKVCNNDEHRNCSVCEKCMRTMLSLEILGKLDSYTSAFDISKYRKKKLGYLAVVESGTIEASADLLENIRKHHYAVPLPSILLGRIIRLGWRIKEMLKSVNLFRDIYFGLKLDYLRFGKEQATVYRYGTKYEL